MINYPWKDLTLCPVQYIAWDRI